MNAPNGRISFRDFSKGFSRASLGIRRGIAPSLFPSAPNQRVGKGERKMSSCVRKAIALYGAAQRGKTPTLNMLIDDLKSAASRVVCEVCIQGCNDRRCCVVYNEVIVGVGTGGDDGNAVHENIQYFENHNCEIVFLATRTKSTHASWTALDDWARKGNVRLEAVHKDETSVVADQPLVNQKQADSLRAMI